MATDAELVAGLGSAPAEAFERLWAAADAMARCEGPHGEWLGGETTDGVMQMPYVTLSPEVLAVVSALGGVGAVVPFDWPDWAAAHRALVESPAAIAGASAADLVRVVTTLVRGDRFNEGLLLAAADDGRLAAAVDGLRRWWEGRPHKAVTPPP